MRGSQLILAAQLLLAGALAKPIKRDENSLYARGAYCAPSGGKPLDVIYPKPGDKPITVTKEGQQVYTCLPQAVKCHDDHSDDCETDYNTKTYHWVKPTQVPCEEDDYCYVTDYEQPITFSRKKGYGEKTVVACPTPGSYWIDGAQRWVPEPNSFEYKKKLDSYYVAPYSEYKKYLESTELSIEVDSYTCVDGKCSGVKTSLYFKHIVTEETVVVPWQRKFPVYSNGPFRYHDPQYNFDIDITINNAPTIITFSTTVTSTVTTTIGSTGSASGTVAPQPTSGPTVPVGRSFALAVNAASSLKKRQGQDGSVAVDGEEYVGASGNVVNANAARAFVINSDGSCTSNGQFISIDEDELDDGIIPFPFSSSRKSIATLFSIGFNNEFLWANNKFASLSALFCRSGDAIYFRASTGEGANTANCEPVVLRAREFPLFPGQTTSAAASTTTTAPATTTSAGDDDELSQGVPAGPDSEPFALDLDIETGARRLAKRATRATCAQLVGSNLVLVDRGDGSNCATFRLNSAQKTLFVNGQTQYAFVTSGDISGGSGAFKVKSGARGQDTIQSFATGSSGLVFTGSWGTAKVCLDGDNIIFGLPNCPGGTTQATFKEPRPADQPPTPVSTTTSAPATTTTTPASQAADED